MRFQKRQSWLVTNLLPLLAGSHLEPGIAPVLGASLGFLELRPLRNTGFGDPHWYPKCSVLHFRRCICCAKPTDLVSGDLVRQPGSFLCSQPSWLTGSYQLSQLDTKHSTAASQTGLLPRHCFSTEKYKIPW